MLKWPSDYGTDFQIQSPHFKTTGSLGGRLSLPSFQDPSNEY